MVTAGQATGETTSKTMKRRGILAAAGAVVAGIAAQQTSQSVRAAADTNFVATGGSGTAFNVATGGYGTGVSTTGSNYGISSSVGSGYGVFAVTSGSGGSDHAGVYGGAGGTGNYGVRGVGSGVTTGVSGQSDGGIGVSGVIPATVGLAPPVANTAANTVAVKGVNQSAGAGGFGVYGSSVRSFGGWFEAGGDQGSGGVVGVARSAGTVGFQALALSPATTAGFFSGSVSVLGSLGVTGGKFAVVQGSDGQYRGMYAVESPECWFEDFGTGTLAGGKAEITLEPPFAQHVHTDSYHVFLTEHDQNNSLHVTGRTAQGFSVQADDATLKAKGKAAASVAGTFSYRVVAKRNDIAGDRLPVWAMPTPAFTRPEPPTPAPLPGKKP
jgi:hypothetical protein